jgi:hypothetical protein
LQLKTDGENGKVFAEMRKFLQLEIEKALIYRKW